MFYGSLVALVTPMDSEGFLDKARMTNLIEMHIEQGTDGFVILGTTGESPTITDEERKDIVQFSVNQVAGRKPVIIGTGTNSTAKSIHYTKQAMDAGADACLVVVPYYNKPTQEGMYQHFKTIADAVAIPQILYNVPGRTSSDLLPETVARLAHVPNIIGIKEASGKLERTIEILELCNGEIDVYSGEDALTTEIILAGGKGVISVTANVAPKLMHEMCQYALQGEDDKARTIDEKLQALHRDLFIEGNPAPVKWALYKMGLIESGIRLPLLMLSERNQAAVLSALQHAGIL
ncbi:MAG: 4-hydroxy-tetrahydrodipicolinate synthase [Gammaproteobacteria bacterium]